MTATIKKQSLYRPEYCEAVKLQCAVLTTTPNWRFAM